MDKGWVHLLRFFEGYKEGARNFVNNICAIQNNDVIVCSCKICMNLDYHPSNVGKVFPPSFFDIMVYLPIHLDVKCC
ncbi:hypothetical protein Sjap_022004 [Stephania japonica]|uniref:Transposase-associated domain-containing protein n=1 Tax=Stephania japonica TaxID=461633 RepID=A0AAP0HTB6_9MAGN